MSLSVGLAYNMVVSGISKQRIYAPLFVLGSVVSVQFGQAFGKTMFDLVGSAAGVAFLRLSLAALLLMVMWRPRLPRDPAKWRLIVGFGTAIAGMNLIYPALAYLPLGMATTLQLLGPLTLALVSSHHCRDLLWSSLATAGVALFYLPQGVDFSLPGFLFAAASAAAMAAYLLLSKKAGAMSSDGSLLAYAVAWAALLYLPFGVMQAGAALVSSDALMAGTGLAILSAVIPYSLDQVALRTLPPKSVGVLESLEPAVASIAGLLVLNEVLAVSQWMAVCLVTVASLGAVLFGSRA